MQGGAAAGRRPLQQSRRAAGGRPGALRTVDLRWKLSCAWCSYLLIVLLGGLGLKAPLGSVHDSEVAAAAPASCRVPPSRVPAPGARRFLHPAGGGHGPAASSGALSLSSSTPAWLRPGPGQAAGLLALAAVAQRRRPTGSFTIVCVPDNFKRCVICLIAASATITNERIVHDFLCHKYLFAAPA